MEWDGMGLVPYGTEWAPRHTSVEDEAFVG